MDCCFAEIARTQHKITHKISKRVLGCLRAQAFFGEEKSRKEFPEISNYFLFDFIYIFICFMEVPRNLAI